MSSKTDFSEMQKLKVEEIEKILQQYLPKQQGYQKLIMEAMTYSLLAGGGRISEDSHRSYELQSHGGRKKTAPYVDAGNISSVRRGFQSHSSIYGCNRDDSYLFACT